MPKSYQLYLLHLQRAQHKSRTQVLDVCLEKPNLYFCQEITWAFCIIFGSSQYGFTFFQDNFITAYSLDQFFSPSTLTRT